MSPQVMLAILALTESCAWACTPAPVPVPPTPDSGDGGAYVACCASMGDTAPECPATLQHVVKTHLTTNAAACSKCGLACK
jgi:hypothetical protein